MVLRELEGTQLSWLKDIFVGKQRALSKAEIQAGFIKNNIDLATKFWTNGMTQAQPLWSIRELRWLVSGGAGKFWAFTDMLQMHKA